MIPASNIGKHNYNILGNKLVGETHASRMQRVNQLQPMDHSLKNPNMGAAFLPANAGVVTDSVTYGLVGGLAGALLTQLSGTDNKENRTYGTLGGGFLGVAAALAANKYRVDEPTPVFDSKFSQLVVGGGTLIVGGLAAGLLGLDWDEVAPSFKKEPAFLVAGLAAAIGLPIALGATTDTMSAITIGGAASIVGVALAHQLAGSVSN
jgi:uncharacterized membrane protein YjjP (DUF1212 family)